MREQGFTVPELIIVAVLTAVFSTMLLQFTVNAWQVGYKVQADSEAFTERLNASDYFREMIGTSTGLINQNSIADINVPADAQDAAGAGSQFWQVIHADPGTRGTATSTTPLLYFRRLSTNSAKQVIMNGETPYEDEYVVYHDGPTKQLRVRTLANPNAPDTTAKTSCPPEAVTADCPSDKILVNYLTSVDLTYYSRSGLLIDYLPAIPTYDSDGNLVYGPDFPAVEVAELKLRISRGAAFNSPASTRSATIIRIALRNT